MSGSPSREEVLALLDRLERGELRAAEPDGDGWRVNPEVKEGILLAFRLGVDVDVPAPPFAFRDRDTLPPRGELPPGVRSAFHGFLVMPVRSHSVADTEPNSGVVVLPMSTNPAQRSRSTGSSSSTAGSSDTATEP